MKKLDLAKLGIIVGIGVLVLLAIVSIIFFFPTPHKQVCHDIERPKPAPVVFDQDLSGNILEILASDVVNYSCGDRVLVTKIKDSTQFDCWINGTIRNRTEGCSCHFSFIGYDTVRVCK